MTGIGSLAIEPPEADKLAQATQRVLRWYDVPEISEKVIDHVNLATTLVAVYGTRITSALLNRDAAAQSSAPPAPPSPTRPDAPAPDSQPREPQAVVPHVIGPEDQQSRAFGTL